MPNSGNRAIIAQRGVLVAVASALAFALFGPSVSTQNRESVMSPASSDLRPVIGQSPAEVEAYWTPERRAEAIPLEIGVYGPSVSAQLTSSEGLAAAVDARPGAAMGTLPSSPIGGGTVLPLFVQPQTTAPFSPPSSPTDFGNYAPFQRWTHFGNYLTYPISTIGKLFFTQNGINYTCSASVIGRNTIATAAHCVHDGSGTDAGYSSNLSFCPSLALIGMQRGCWSGIYRTTSGNWYASAAYDRDYGCIVTAATGSTIANNLGNVTGMTGRAWNWPSRQMEMTYGYAGTAPFPGYHIIVSASTEWYEVNESASDGLVSKYIGSDMDGGASGGPWWISIRHPNTAFDYTDTDGSGLTDPPSFGAGTASGGPYLNGVNSHKRCTQAACGAGTVFTQEMGSPQFMNTVPDTDESEDVFARCFANGGV